MMNADLGCPSFKETVFEFSSQELDPASGHSRTLPVPWLPPQSTVLQLPQYPASPPGDE